MEIERISADVLVIGSGAAGLRAALEARRQGADVWLLSKGRTGLGNVTAVAGGGIVAPFGHADPRDNSGVLFADTLASGRGLCDPNLVRAFVAEACNEVSHLHRLGLPFRTEPDGRFVQLYQPGHTYPRDCKIAGPTRTETWVPVFEGGRLLNMTLKKAALELGVKTVERTVVFDLYTDDLGVLGAVGVTPDLKWVVIESRAVILATGGAGEVYKHNATPPDTTGDGYRLALRHGVSLLDMEFVQFYPVSIVEPGIPHWYLPYWYFFENGALLYNVKGEDLLVREGLTKIEEITRDKLARACGQYETILLDCTPMKEPTWEERDFRAFRDELLKHRFDPREKPFRVSPTGYYFMGGIKIDDACRTSLAGLYAAGEVVGGIHGANRLGSNELPADLVFGAIAGRGAALHASKISRRPVSEARVKRSCEEISGKSGRGKAGSRHPSLIRRDIQEIMWKYAIWVRSSEGLRKALDELAGIRERQMPLSRAGTFQELKQSLENEALLDTAEMVCQAALLREESRGSHLRVDCPDEEPTWEKNILISAPRGGNRLELTAQPPPRDFVHQTT